MGDASEWKDLPTLDKIEHKNWKARLEGYEAALKEMQMANDGKDPLFTPYLNLVKKMVIDNNAVAQEKSLEVVELFCTEANCAGRAASEISAGIVSKCLNSVRPKTRERAGEIMKLLIEAEKHDVVVEELIKGLEQKAPKTVVGSILVLKESLHEFGPKVVSLKEIIKNIPKLLEDRDKGIRENGKELIIEIYRWIGKAPLEPMLNQLKPVQVTELTNEFEKIEPKNCVPTRYLKSQKPKTTALVQQTTSGSGDAVKIQPVSTVPDMDPYDLIDPVEVIKKMPSNYYEKLEEKKWTERKEALEAVDTLTNNPKLNPGDYGDLVKSLLRTLSKDSNIVLATLSAKILKQLAIGLRKKFSPYAVETLKACFEKFKEKKVNVVTTIRECVDAAFATTSLDNSIEDIHTALSHKTPSVRSEVALFLNRIFENCTQEQLPKKHLKVLAADLAKLCMDSTPEVREAVFAALGTAMMVVTEKNIKPFLESVENVKQARIKEFYDKAIANKSGNNQDKKAAPVVTSAPPPASVSKPAVEHATSKPSSGVKGKTTLVKKPPSAQTQKANAASEKAVAASKQSSIPTEPSLSEDDAINKANDIFGEPFVPQLTDKNYKERLQAIETLQKHIENQPTDKIPCQLVVRLVMLKPGLKDNNIQVLRNKIELIKLCLTKGKMTWTAAELCIPDLTEKIGDIKNNVLVKSTLTDMSDALDVALVAEAVIKTASETVNLKNIIESLVWVREAIQDFGLKIGIDKMLPFIKLSLAHTNPTVRQAAIRLIGTISLYVRDKIGDMLSEEKPSIKQLIDAEILKMKDIQPEPPTKGLKNEPATTVDSCGDVESKVSTNKSVAAAPSAVVIDPEEFLPRESICHRLNEELLNKFAEKSWKVKKEAFDELAEIVKGHSGIKSDGLQNLFAAIAKITTDNSAIISKLALASLGNLCKLLLRKDAEKYVRTVIPGLMASCSDAKPKNREDAVAALNIWIDKVGFAAISDAGMISDAIRVDNPYQKATVLTWMLPHIKKFSEDPQLKKTLYTEFVNDIMPPFFACLEERNPDVRKAAQEVTVPLMTIIGYEKMLKHHEANTKLASNSAIRQILDKAKEQLPQDQQKKAATQPPGPTASKKEPTTATESKKSTTESKSKKDESKIGSGKVKNKTKSSTNKAPSATTAASTEAPLGTTLLNKASNKRQRIMEDKKKKLTKWEANSYNLQLIETLWQTNCSVDLHTLLFSKDFKHHNKAIDQLNNFISETDNDSIEATRANLDLILKWIVFRLNETNPSTVNKALDYLNKVFTIFTSDAPSSFQLHEQEAVAFIPDLVVKIGDSKDQVRSNARRLLQLIMLCYNEQKIVQFLEEGLENKVSRIRQESADFLREMIDDRKLDPFNQKPTLKLISGLIGERDNGVRTAALNCLVSAHNYMGEDLMVLLKNLTQKDTDMLLERIKRTGRPVDAAELSSLTTNATTATTTGSSNSTQPSNNIPGGKAASKISKMRESLHEQNTTNTAASGRLSNSLNVATDFHPILQEDICNKLINVDKDIQEINEPLQKIELHYTGRSNQTVNSSEAIRAVINDINDNDIEKSILAMAQIDEVVRHEDMFSHLKPHMDKLIGSITMHLKKTLDRLNDDQFNESEITDIFRGMLATLSSVLNAKELAQSIGRAGLIDLMSVLLQIVLNDQLVALSDGATIIRCINVLSVRILDNVNQTLMLGALIRMMNECLKRGDFSSKYLYLIFKCLWSMTKGLVNTIKHIDLPVVIRDINTFFVEFPLSTWENSARDVPLRTMKTLIHGIINNNNGGILELLYRIPNAPGGELDAYIRKSYEKCKISIPAVLPTPIDDLATSSNIDDHDRFNDFDLNTQQSVDYKSTFDKERLKQVLNSSNVQNMTLHSSKRPYLDELKQIFKKIGDPAEKQQGLEDLYDFKIKYAYVDLNRYLCQTSKYFQDTIEIGLSEIAKSRLSKPQQQNNNNNHQQHSNNTSKQEDDKFTYCDMDPKTLRQRLIDLRLSLHLDNSKLKGSAGLSSDRSREATTASATNNNEMENSFLDRLDQQQQHHQQRSNNNSNDAEGHNSWLNSDSNAGGSALTSQRKMSDQELSHYRERMKALTRKQ